MDECSLLYAELENSSVSTCEQERIIAWEHNFVGFFEVCMLNLGNVLLVRNTLGEQSLDIIRWVVNFKGVGIHTCGYREEIARLWEFKFLHIKLYRAVTEMKTYHWAWT
jgi:hypothetical protein